MDAYTPALIDYGIVQFIGKGARANAVNLAMKGRAVHFAATGGAGMLYASCVTSCEMVAFPDLGAEAVYRLEVTEFPVVVTYDLLGNDVYNLGRAK
jgi:fumarate hydratase subunit beta